MSSRGRLRREIEKLDNANFTRSMPMTDEERRARIAAALAEEANEPERYWYLSFVDKKFLGGCFVRARGMTHAIVRTHQLRINPGGEVAGWEVPEAEGAPPFPLDTLLTKEQMRGATLGELEAASGNAYQS